MSSVPGPASVSAVVTGQTNGYLIRCSSDCSSSSMKRADRLEDLDYRFLSGKCIPFLCWGRQKRPDERKGDRFIYWADCALWGVIIVLVILRFRLRSEIENP